MVNWRSDDDETATVLAAEGGCAEILRYLLQNGGKAFGEYPKENLLDCVTRYTHMPNRNKAASEIIKFCVKDEEVDDLKKVKKLQSYNYMREVALKRRMIEVKEKERF